jgi:phosphatidylserine decarboxylase
MMEHFFTPLHREGWIFVAIFAALSLVLGAVATPLGYVGAVLTGWCLYFFRDPHRMVPTRPGLIVSPASGVVTSIVDVVPPAEMNLGEAPLTRVSVFLNVFDVHVNRVPVGGVVRTSIYHAGKFLNATLDKSSDENERQCLVVETDQGVKIGFTQIAGLIARRIRCDIHEGDVVETGQRFGLIRFGSRMDIYLPAGTHPLVVVGQTMTSGETVVADMASSEDQRQGAWR